MTTGGSPITQVAEHNVYNDLIQDDYIQSNILSSRSIKLDLRGERINVDVDTLVLFPDSLTHSLFPDGLGLLLYTTGRTSTSIDHIHTVDFDPACFHYLYTFFQQARQADHRLSGVSLESDPLLSSLLAGDKQLVIVLREDLDYFILPQQPLVNKTTRQRLKTQAGHHLEQENKVFDALISNIEKENNRAEEHLVTMLCEAGFNRDDQWGFRALDPKRTVLTSLSLCCLTTSDPSHHMDILQRFMLFWKKPARKCWWDADQVDLDGNSVRLWKRRTFWLELATT
ncbi:hypothetical protein BC941DRAFT_353383 [Chlamydoabsidia padenii]|nr:hypothetical protein BC941DRAFT_353383 [Chlamydoabsidia padenii]